MHFKIHALKAESSPENAHRARARSMRARARACSFVRLRWMGGWIARPIRWRIGRRSKDGWIIINSSNRNSISRIWLVQVGDFVERAREREWDMVGYFVDEGWLPPKRKAD